MLSEVVLRDPAQRCWFLYRKPLAVLATDDHAEVAAILSAVEQRVEAERLYAAGFVCYGAAAGFDRALPGQLPGSLPLICFGLYEQRQRLESLSELTLNASPRAAELDWRLLVSRREYRQAVGILRAHIGRGDTYQVNYTARLQAPGRLNAAAFARIAADAPYGAYLDGEHFTIVSASPELFFERVNGRLQSRPMKGTAPRGLDGASDEQAARWLKQSTKNRAENLMITDMVRNDMGRIARPGSVQATALFEVERYPTVWQMTSTVEAETEVDTTEVFRALFPGASITGAPKRAAMQLINEFEPLPRDIYTGSIGVMEPGGLRRFNIAIRTALTDKRTDTTSYGAGGGIVWDSDPDEEYAELLAKTRVLYAKPQQFQLLETMRWEPRKGIFLRAQHLARLAASAEYFNFSLSMTHVEQRLDAQLNASPEREHALKVRLLLNPDGSCEVQTTALADQHPDAETPAQAVMFAETPVDSADVFLYHKTTQRSVYERAAQEVPTGVEPLLVNEQGMVTESNIANVVYRMGGELYTPPVADGLLPGTLRAQLLRQGTIKERSLHVGETAKVEAWYLINALRGWRRAELQGEKRRVQDLLFS